MDDPHDQSADNPADLNDAIDDLLDEIDSACAEPTAKEQPQPTQDPEPTAAEPEPESPAPESAPDAGIDALETLDAIADSADSLLDDAIDAMLDDAETEDPQPAQEPRGEQPPEPILENDPVMAFDAPDVDILADAIDGILEEPTPEPEPEQEPEPEPLPESAPEPVAEPVAEPASEPEQPEPAASSEDLGVIDELDDALATAADDLLDGSFETPQGDLVEPTTVDYAVDPSLLLDPEQTDAAPTKPEPEPQAETPTEPAPEPIAEPEQPEPQQDATEEPAPAMAETTPPAPTPPTKTSEQPAQPAATIAPPPPKIEAPAAPAVGAAAGSALTKARDFAAPIADRAITAAGPLGAKAVLTVAKPLADKSPETRNAVGWVALWTMFLAIVVWGYALLIRTPSIPTPDQAPTRVVTPETTPGVTASHLP